MNPREQNLKTIRDATVAANPEILKRAGYKKIDPQFEGMDVGVEESFEAPIHLADVLLAMQNGNESVYIRFDGVFFRWEKFTSGGDGHHGVASTYVEYNLRKDSLDDQSDDCLEFLAGILKTV